MKIKAKLLTLIISMLVAMTLTIGSYIVFSQYTSNLEREKQLLQEYRNSLMETHKELLRFNLDRFVIVEQMVTFNKALETSQEAFIRLEQIVLLPTLDEEAATALNNITKLEQYNTGGINKFYTSTDNLLEAVKGIMGTKNKFELNSIVDVESGYERKEVTKLRYYLKKMKQDLYFVEVGFQTAVNIIDEQYAVIDNQVESFETWATRTSLSLFGITLILSVIIAMITSSKIVKSIHTIGSSLSIMAKGDLSHEITAVTKDEIGVLSGEMNEFQDGLNDALNRIKRYSVKSEEIKNYLINTATEASAASVEIAANINSVDTQMTTLNNNILDSSSKVSEISNYTNELNNHITDQMAMVEESTASITEMIASISSVSNLTERNREVMENLQETAKEGDNQISETTEKIEDINEAVKNIGAMAEVIQNIADQTNLLAMNAAIEAAHAGDAGKGFAVVADEIRKLSEASANSSKDIAKNLKDMVKKFDDASVSSINTRDAFGKIYESINSVSSTLITIASSTQELNIGGTQILEAMDSLSSISADVQDKSEIMKSRADSVKGSIHQVSEISTIVTHAMNEVNVGFNEVKDSISGLEKISGQVGNVSRDLNIECNKFVTAEFPKDLEELKHQHEEEMAKED